MNIQKKFFQRIRILLLAAASGTPFLHGTAQDMKPTLFLISDTHLDTQWNWNVKTTINDYIYKTMTENMALMDKYPSFLLNYEGAIKYMWMKEYYPAEFERLKSYVASGQWHVSGLSVDANDVMISSAESILRNMLYANHFYMKEFGVRGGYDIMLPDCFGFSYALTGTPCRHQRNSHSQTGMGSSGIQQSGTFRYMAGSGRLSDIWNIQTGSL